MLSLFDQFTTKKPQFDAYPFLNQSVIQRWKGTRWKIKNLICSDEIGVVRMNSEGLLRRKSFLFGWIRTCFDGYGFGWTNILFVVTNYLLVWTNTLFVMTYTLFVMTNTLFVRKNYDLFGRTIYLFGRIYSDEFAICLDKYVIFSNE